MKLEIAQKMVTAALAAARTRNLKPLAVAVLDARGALKAFAAEDGTSLAIGGAPSPRSSRNSSDSIRRGSTYAQRGSPLTVSSTRIMTYPPRRAGQPPRGRER